MNFVKGSAEPPSECTNTSSVRASFTDDAKLAALLGSATGSSSSSSSPSAATSSGAASALRARSATGPAWSGAVVALLVGGVFGGVLLL